MSRDNGGPAFPMQVHYDANGERYSYEPGMTLRDWFAGQALVTIANAQDVNGVATFCYMIADAMIAERSQCTE